MKRLDAIPFSYDQCRREVAEFHALLDASPVLEESQTVLPFFQQRPQLSALCGILNSSNMNRANRIAWEFDIFGDFACDLLVGDWEKKAYRLIEFEDASPHSIFKPQGKKATREWSPRFEHGFSQIIDWFYKLDGRTNSDDCEARFGKRAIDYDGMLVIGRDRDIDPGERLRLEWRRRHVIVHSKKILCVTFDELLKDMEAWLDALALVAGTPGQG